MSSCSYDHGHFETSACKRIILEKILTRNQPSKIDQKNAIKCGMYNILYAVLIYYARSVDRTEKVHIILLEFIAIQI